MNGHRKFYLCKHCRNLVGMINNAGVKLICCGEEMSELVPNTVDASTEKHVPVAVIDGNRISVQVGKAPHPMGEEHRIEWIYLETEKGGQRKDLEIDAPPTAEFVVTDDKPVAVYAYCNLHGLWKTEV